MNIPLQKLLLRMSFFGLILGFLCILSLNSFGQIISKEKLLTNVKVTVDLPNPVITAVSPGTAIVPAGQTFSVTDAVWNIGTTSTSHPIQINYFFTESATGPPTDELGWREMGILKSGEISTATTTVTIPLDTTPGNYYVRAQFGKKAPIGKPVYSVTKIKVAPATARILSVRLSGGGIGTVSGFPDGTMCTKSEIARDAFCSSLITTPTNPVRLSVTVTDGNTQFDGWSSSASDSAACSGKEDCTVTMSGAKTVTATFSRFAMVTVRIIGSNKGTLWDALVGGKRVLDGDRIKVTLPGNITLRADPGWSVFAGWSANCVNPLLLPGANLLLTTTTPINNDETCTATFRGP